MNNNEEFLDLVDEEDNVIGTVSKTDANSNPRYIHREVSVIIYDDKNQILFQQRSLKKKVLPGVWGISCAGHVPKNMPPLEAAHKELQEELGFDTELSFVEKRRLTLPNESRFIYVYTGKYNNKKIVPDPGETEALKFMSEEEFDKTIKSGVKYAEVAAELVKQLWSRVLQ